MIFVAVMVSRNRKLRQCVDSQDPDKRQKEAELLTKFVVYSNSEAHSSIEKACNMAMLRFRPVIVIP
jgi:glutamate/tyrosine decarboxylase-like PLP-dependent enzyme